MVQSVKIFSQMASNSQKLQKFRPAKYKPLYSIMSEAHVKGGWATGGLWVMVSVYAKHAKFCAPSLRVDHIQTFRLILREHD